MTAAEFRKMISSFDATEEQPHFDRIAFRITGKRIFATLHEKSLSANLKLSPEDQSAFSTFGKDAVYAIPNKWGQQGWTTFELKHLPKTLVKDALATAYRMEAAWTKSKKKK
jgi:hypothetical protein